MDTQQSEQEQKRATRWAELDRVLALAVAATEVEQVAAAVDRIRWDCAEHLFPTMPDHVVARMIEHTFLAFVGVGA